MRKVSPNKVRVYFMLWPNELALSKNKSLTSAESAFSFRQAFGNKDLVMVIERLVTRQKVASHKDRRVLIKT